MIYAEISIGYWFYNSFSAFEWPVHHKKTEWSWKFPEFCPFLSLPTQGTCQSCGAGGPNLWACLQVNSPLPPKKPHPLLWKMHFCSYFFLIFKPSSWQSVETHWMKLSSFPVWNHHIMEMSVTYSFSLLSAIPSAALYRVSALSLGWLYLRWLWGILCWSQHPSCTGENSLSQGVGMCEGQD